MYSEAYAKNMKKQIMAMNPIKDGTKQQGTDIDSLLDATYATPAFSIETDDLLDL